MTGQPPQHTQPGELPAPRTDTDSAPALAEAVDTLAALARRQHGRPARPRKPHRSSAHEASRRRSRRPRPRPHLGRDRAAAQSHSRHRSPSIPNRTMINLTAITRIMAQHLLHHLHVGA